MLPDPSLLCRGLDKLHAQVFTPSKHPSAASRIASFKLERQLDYKAKATDVEDYAQLILGELEAALLAQPMAPPPKLNRMEESGGQEAAKGKNKGKGKTQQPCWAWSDGSGCKYGQNCMFRHDPLGQVIVGFVAAVATSSLSVRTTAKGGHPLRGPLLDKIRLRLRRPPCELYYKSGW